MNVNEKMTAIADMIRGFTGKTDKLSLDDMPSNIGLVHAAGIGKGESIGYQLGFQEGATPLSCASIVQFADMNKFGKSEVEINISSVTDYYHMFADTVANTTVTHLTINGANDGTIIAVDSAFYAAKSDNKLERITLNCDFSQCPKFQYMIGMRNALKIIDGTPIDFSNATFIGALLMRCTALVEMRVAPNSIKVAIDLSNNSKLSYDTINSLIDGLATVSTTKTLTLNSAVKSNLTDAQKTKISNKNWQVA